MKICGRALSALFVFAVAFIARAQDFEIGSLVWSNRTGGPIVSSPALSDDESTLYVGSGDRHLYAFWTDADAADPEFPEDRVKWRIKLGGLVNSSPLVTEDGMIYVGSTDGSLYAIEDGEDAGPLLKWRFRTRRPIRSSPAIDEEGTIYVGSQDHLLYAIFHDGAPKWTFRGPADINSSPVIAEDGTIYIASGAVLFGVSESGSQVSAFRSGDRIQSVPAIAEDGTIYFGSNDDFVYALEEGTGTNSIRWRVRTPDQVMSSPAIGVSGRVYIGGHSRQVFCLSTNGAQLWRRPFKTRGVIRSPVSIGADGTVYVGDDAGWMYAIQDNGTNGLLKWEFRTKRPIRSSPAIGSDGTVYFTSMDRNVYAVYDNVPAEASPWRMFRKDPQHSARADIGEPFIIEQPQELVVRRGETITLTVRATAGAPFTYQWRFNGVDIDPDVNPSAATATLVIPNAQPSHEGLYTVSVENDFGEVESDEVLVTVLSEPVIVTDITNRIVSVGSRLELSVVAEGTGSLTYQWFKDGVAQPGAVGPSFLVTTNAQLANAGSYHVTISNAIGATNSRTAVVTVVALSLQRDARSVAAGNRISAAIGDGNLLFTWGLNAFGQLGDSLGNTGDTNAHRATPRAINNETNWASISAGGRGYDARPLGGHMLALKTDGSLWGWGSNDRGQLALGHTNHQNVPIPVGADTNWIQVEAGAAHSVGLKRDGSLWTWGAGDSGQLGHGTTNSLNVPTQVGIDQGWVEVRAGGHFTLARRYDGTVWAWGRNNSGQLGINSTNNQRSPVQITDGTWVNISAGVEHSLGRQADGSMWIWGRNFGLTTILLNSGTNIFRTPVSVGGGTQWTNVDAGFNHSLALNAEGRLHAWGANNIGQLGNNLSAPTNATATNSLNLSSPVEIGGDRRWIAIDAGVKHSLARASDGTVWAWGWNNHGQVGDGSGGDGTEANNRRVPIQLNFSNTVPIVTNLAPAIIQQPTNISVQIGNSPTLRVSAVGIQPLRYQWRFNSAPLSGATNDVLLLSNIQTNQAGSYTVVITNIYGVATSEVALVSVMNPVVSGPPVITQHPTNRSISINGTAVFAVTANGAQPLRYQWRHSSTNIPLSQNGWATNHTILIQNAQVANAGDYQVVVSNDNGSVTSLVATLTLTNIPSTSGPPAIVVQPAATPFINQGGSISLQVVAEGEQPLSYQWRFHGTNLLAADNNTVNTFRLTLTNVSTNDSGPYDVVVSNALGVTNSAVSTLTVVNIVPPVPPLESASSAAIAQILYRHEQVVLVIQATAGTPYRVQFTDSLEQPEWINMTSGVGDGTVHLIADPAPGASMRFYRIDPTLIE